MNQKLLGLYGLKFNPFSPDLPNEALLQTSKIDSSGVQVAYRNLPPAEYEAALLGFGLPRMTVEVAIDADLKAQQGALDSSSRDLSRLLGRPTTALPEAVAAAVGAYEG